MQLFRKLLFPFSWIYRLVVWTRNALFDRGILKGKKAALPTIVIGNVHVGGTGKSPHTIWLANELKSTYSLAILSRGYGRKSTGFLDWQEGMSAETFGDEPCQYVHRLPEVRVSVCENRLLGIERIAATGNEEVVLLDDALQHRKLIGDINMVLMRADELPHHSSYLPSGNLRDHLNRLRVADVVIVTGVQHYWDQRRLEDLRSELNLSAHCIITSSKLSYGNLLNHMDSAIEYPEEVILVTGIANPAPFNDYVSERTHIKKHFSYSDHHNFSEKDWQQWVKASGSGKTSILTTEKDMMRMSAFRDRNLTICYVPIIVRPEHADTIVEYVRASISPKK